MDFLASYPFPFLSELEDPSGQWVAAGEIPKGHWYTDGGAAAHQGWLEVS